VLKGGVNFIIFYKKKILEESVVAAAVALGLSRRRDEWENSPILD